MKNNVCLKRYFLTMIAAVLCAGFASPSRAGTFEVAIPEALRPKFQRILSRLKSFAYTETRHSKDEIRSKIDRKEDRAFRLIDEAPDDVFRLRTRGTAKYRV